MDSDGCFDPKKFKKISTGLGYSELSANEYKIFNVKNQSILGMF